MRFWSYCRNTGLAAQQMPDWPFEDIALISIACFCILLIVGACWQVAGAISALICRNLEK